MSAADTADLMATSAARLVCDATMQAMKRDIETLARPVDPAQFGLLMQLALQYAATVGMKVATDELMP